MIDDQPVWLKTRTKPIVNIPYTQECNDVAMMLIQHHKASEYYDRAMDQFEQIYADAEGSARVMAMVVHPYIMGAPHRLKYFRSIFENIRKKPDVTFLTGEQIFDWFVRRVRRRHSKAQGPAFHMDLRRPRVAPHCSICYGTARLFAGFNRRRGDRKTPLKSKGLLRRRGGAGTCGLH